MVLFENCTKIVKTLHRKKISMKVLSFFIISVFLLGIVSSSYAHKSQTIGNYEIEIGWQDEPPMVGQANAIMLMITSTSIGKQNIEHNTDNMESEHQKILEEHAQMIEEHKNMLSGGMDKDAVIETLQRHNKIMEEHEEIIKKHQTMKEHFTEEQWSKINEDHEKISEDHKAIMKQHEEIMEMYGISEDEISPHTHDMESEHQGGITGLESEIDAYVTLNGIETKLEFVEDTDQLGLYTAQYTPLRSGHPIVHIALTVHGEFFEIEMHPEKVEKHKKLTPLEQQIQGIPPNEVECAEDKLLLAKISDGSAICLSPQTAEKLVSRGWATHF